MKRSLLLLVSVALVAALLIVASPIMAAKPPQVITASNGFPSGMHFNLNIHGKDPLTFTYPPPPYEPPYGNSIFIPEDTSLYDPVTIEAISEKKGSATELEVIDPYAMPAPDDGVARFKLPYNIMVDDQKVNANGYYVYGRIHGKPNNNPKDEGGPSKIILTPDPLLQFDYDGAEFPVGLVTSRGAYKMGDSGEFVRFDDSSASKGKGRSLARNLTDMFMWTGWVCDSSLDLIEDGVIDNSDLDSYNDANGTAYASVDEWLTALNDPSLARYYEDWWVFDVADTIVQSWGIDNQGTKLLQIRFYPVATTKFTEEAHIVVKKVTDPITDTDTLFDFETSYRDTFQMTNNQFSLSLGLSEGIETVKELALPEGWDLTSVDIDDPTGGSTVDGALATIDLAEGETVIVTFTNTQRGKIIVIKEYADPENDPGETFSYTSTFADFDLSGHGNSYESDWLPPNVTYNVTEESPLPGRWDFTSIEIDDPDGGSYASGQTATIDLDIGEIVTVTFTNTYTPEE